MGGAPYSLANINRHCVPLFTKNTLLSSLTPILFSEQVILAEALSQNSWCLETIKENHDKIERNAHLSSLTPIFFKLMGALKQSKKIRIKLNETPICQA
jgi:hypothetical protein